MDDGEGLFIIAALVIAFINWLSNSLKRKAALREQERRRARGELVEEESVDWGMESDDSTFPEPDEPVVRESQDPNAEIRAFFEALSGNAPQQAPPPPQEAPVAVQAQPTPVAVEQAPDHWRAPEVRRGRLSAAEKAALSKVRDGFSKPQRKRGDNFALIRRLFREGGVRDAVIFAEVLGKPKSLEEDEATTWLSNP